MALQTAAAKSSSSSRPRRKSFFVSQIVLRILAIAFSLVAISVMVTSTQVVVLFGITFSASYSAASAWRFLLGVDIVTSIASALLLIFVCFLNRLGSHLSKYFVLFLLDMAMMVLLISGCAAATAIGHVSKYGEFRVGWSPVCNTVPKFCNKSTISLVFSYLAFFSYLALSIMSASELMSRSTDELEGKGNENKTEPPTKY